jgi:hypothetical protein
MALDKKLTLMESIEQGYPNPVDYVINTWIPRMLDRIYGILGHKVYYPTHIIILFQVLFMWMLLLGFRYWKRLSLNLVSVLFIIFAYAFVVLLTNYDGELVYGFKHIAMQGRYLFPVIGLIYVLFGYTLEQVSNKPIYISTLLMTLALFLAGGPLKFILHYNTIFLTWFIH